MITEIFKIALFIGVFIGVCFIIYTNFSPHRKDKSIIYLNFFVLFFTINNLQITLADYHYISLNFFERKMLLPFYVLIIPSFYTFVVHYIKIEKQIQSYVGISLMLFAAEIALRLVLYPFYHHENNNFIVAQYAQIEEIINVGYTLFLYIKLIYIFLPQSKIPENIASYDNMQWLKKFFGFGLVILVLWIMAIIFNLRNVISPNIPIYYPLRLSSVWIIFWVAYHGFFKYNLLTERIELRKIIQIKIPSSVPPKPALDLQFAEIEQHIKAHHGYLSPKFTLVQLSESMNMSDRKISKILKNNLKNNFTDYINELRVQKAIEILKDKQYEDYTIAAIGLECGFNSKSSFYRAFLKHTQSTPTDYRNKNC